MMKKKKVTLTKSGLKSLLVEAEGGDWRRRGIRWRQARIHLMTPLNIQPVVVVRGLKRQQDAALTNFVRCFFLFYFISFFLF